MKVCVDFLHVRVTNTHMRLDESYANSSHFSEYQFPVLDRSTDFYFKTKINVIVAYLFLTSESNNKLQFVKKNDFVNKT